MGGTPRIWPPEGKFATNCAEVAMLWKTRYPGTGYRQAVRLIAEATGHAERSVMRWIAGARERGML